MLRHYEVESRLPGTHYDLHAGAKLTRENLRLWSLVLVIACLSLPAARANEQSRTIFGYVERVVITDKGFSLKARLDTGAETSSLDAHNIRRFRRGDSRYVRFDVRDPDTDEFVTLERPLVRIVRIRQHEGPSMQRPVVMMKICLGELLQEVEVSLTPRTEFLYPMLIGRSAMRGAIIVDPERTFTNSPQCDLSEIPE
jgi:hypothetical protein